MPIVSMRAALHERIRAALPTVHVEIHEQASLDARDFDRILKDRSLAVCISFLGIHEEGTNLVGHDLSAPLRWGAYIVAKDAPKIASRHALILSVLPAVGHAIFDWSKSLPVRFDYHAPEKFRARAMDEGDKESHTRSVAVWGVEWTQCADLPAPEVFDGSSDADIKPLLELVTRYDLAPKDEVIEATDEIRMEQ